MVIEVKAIVKKAMMVSMRAAKRLLVVFVAAASLHTSSSF